MDDGARALMPFVLFALVVAWAVMLLFGGMDLDRGLLALLHAGDARPEVAGAARIVTELGGFRVLVPVTAAGAALLLYRRQLRSAVLLVGLTLSGRFLVDLQKIQTARLRPDEQEHLIEVQSLAFPSAHAANATMVYLSLALLLTSAWPRRGLAVWGAVWLAVLIGASRLVLGVHWPTDVIAGWAFGLFWTLLLLRLTGHDIGDGTPRPLRHSSPEGARSMTDRNDRGADRAETARQTDDSALIEGMEGAPSHGNRNTNTLGHDLATRDELKQEVGDPTVTRVRDSDKAAEPDLPRFNQGNSKLNP
ncbi:MAG TPA: phosphatase PAP2 family protein [Allosphingosinicella sp.]|jgi:undecaprenyl-diphosphatase